MHTPARKLPGWEPFILRQCADTCLHAASYAYQCIADLLAGVTQALSLKGFWEDLRLTAGQWTEFYWHMWVDGGAKAQRALPFRGQTARSVRSVCVSVSIRCSVNIHAYMLDASNEVKSISWQVEDYAYVYGTGCMAEPGRPQPANCQDESPSFSGRVHTPVCMRRHIRITALQTCWQPLPAPSP